MDSFGKNYISIGFPITPSLLMAEAKKFNDNYNISNGWIPVSKWYYGFLERHKDLSLRTPQYMPARKCTTTEAQLREWFSKVCNKLKF